MTKITYTLGEEIGTIYWSASEQFKELENKSFNLTDMKASQIEKLTDISLTAKILLSAVAGAIIQHLLDKDFNTELLFSKGTFIVEK